MKIQTNNNIVYINGVDLSRDEKIIINYIDQGMTVSLKNSIINVLTGSYVFLGTASTQESNGSLVVNRYRKKNINEHNKIIIS